MLQQRKAYQAPSTWPKGCLAQRAQQNKRGLILNLSCNRNPTSLHTCTVLGSSVIQACKGTVAVSQWQLKAQALQVLHWQLSAQAQLAPQLHESLQEEQGVPLWVAHSLQLHSREVNLTLDNQ